MNIGIDIDIMIDDSIRVCEKCSSSGISSILFDTEYNRDEKRFDRVNNWLEIYEYIKNYKINVILDTHTYNECDDKFALSYLIKSQDKVNIEAITVAPYFHSSNRNVTVSDGQELSYKEIVKISNWLRFDIRNKVFKGATNYIKNGYIEENEAVDTIIKIALKNNQTYILAIGAITNIALAIKREPKIIDKIRVIWDITVIAYIINKNWFEETKVSCPVINGNTSYELNTNNHKINFVTKIKVV